MQIGIDYAAVDSNKSPDLSKAKAAGLTFAILRGSYHTYPDATCKRDWEAIKAANIVRGAYMFPVITPKAASPEAQVATFIRAMKNAGGIVPGVDLPPTLDIEFPGNGIATTGMKLTDVINWLMTAVGALRKEYGTAPMIYTSKRVVWEDLQNKLPAELSDCIPWIKSAYRLKARQSVDKVVPKEPPIPPPFSWWAIQQYQGDALNFKGFSSTVDVNRFNTQSVGCRGAFVSWIQRKLAMAEGSPGLFDTATAEAVKEFQNKINTQIDGSVGIGTFSHLCWL